MVGSLGFTVFGTSKSAEAFLRNLRVVQIYHEVIFMHGIALHSLFSLQTVVTLPKSLIFLMILYHLGMVFLFRIFHDVQLIDVVLGKELALFRSHIAQGFESNFHLRVVRVLKVLGFGIVGMGLYALLGLLELGLFVSGLREHRERSHVPHRSVFSNFLGIPTVFHHFVGVMVVHGVEFPLFDHLLLGSFLLFRFYSIRPSDQVKSEQHIDQQMENQHNEHTVQIAFPSAFDLTNRL